MKTVICGGRNYIFSKDDVADLDAELAAGGITEVFSGGALGADNCAEVWALSRHIPVRTFKANWKRHGKLAGPLRNWEMARACDRVIAFPGGAGTRNMIRAAREYDRPVTLLGEPLSV